MADLQLSTDKLPVATLADYRQLPQARHGNAQTFTLSLNTIASMPPLPVVDWASIAGVPPLIQQVPGYNSSKPLPKADIVIITWTSAEWAALHHVFCDSAVAMSYNAIANTKNWDGDWLIYARNFDSVLDELTGKSPSNNLKAWGRFRMVSINGKKIMLFKSDMHLHTDGKQMPVKQMIDQIIADSQPGFILTMGTAGGARPQDNLGTANVTNAARFQLTGQFSNAPFNSTTFQNMWTISDASIQKINSLLLTTPVTMDHLNELLAILNKNKKLNLTIEQVINAEIQPGAIPPKVNAVFGQPVLSSNAYDVATTLGNFNQYAAMEMDDAFVAMEADTNHIPFAVIRNISDPVENPNLSTNIQQSWGGTVYNTYGFYTSFNSVLAAWAIVSS